MGKHDITQIKVGQNRVGIIGLKQVLEDVALQSSSMSEEEIRNELVERLGKKNYISPNVRDRYETAFYREFCNYTGKPVEPDNDPGIPEIRVLGRGCLRCDQLYQDIISIISEMKITADVDHVTDLKEIAGYGVMGSPALVINGDVKTVGNVPARQKLIDWICEVNSKN